MMACRLPILLFAAVVMLGLGTAQAKIKVNSGDILLTDQLARTLKLKDGRATGKYATKNTVKLPAASEIGALSQTTVLSNGLAFTTALKGPSIVQPRTKNPTSYVVVSHLAIKGGEPRTFKVPGLGQGSLANCAIASTAQRYGKIGATKAAGSVYEVWLYLDCSCKSGKSSTLASYRILPFTFDSVQNTFQQNRGLEYKTFDNGCNPTSSTKGYLVAELGGRNGNLTAITLPLGLNTAGTTQLDLFFNGKRTPTVQGPDTVTGGFYSNVGGWAIGGYNQFFAAAIRGTNPAATTPPQYTIVHYQHGKAPALLGGVHALPKGSFEPLLATRGGSAAYPVYFFDRPYDPKGKKSARIIAIDRRRPGEAGKVVFAASRHLIDLDVVP